MSEPSDPTHVIVRNGQRAIRVNVAALAEFAQRALETCAVLPGRLSFPLGEVAVLLVSDRRIAGLHRKFMGVTGPTDVITFQHGEIFISVHTARRQARRFGNSFRHELQLYIVHGLLHLRGFDDTEPAGARRMQVLQEEILRSLAEAR